MNDTITIPLTQGKSTVIDKLDADLANKKWHMHCGGYAVRDLWPDRTKQQLHRIILARMMGCELLPIEKTDHRNGAYL